MLAPAQGTEPRAWAPVAAYRMFSPSQAQPAWGKPNKGKSMIQFRLAAAVVALATSASAAAQVPLADFARHVQYNSVKISPDVVDPADVEMLEDLVLAAVRQAMEAATTAASDQLGGLTGGLDLGGLLG